MKTAKATIGIGMLAAAGLVSVPQVRAEPCPLSLTPYGQLFPGEVVVDATTFEDQRVDFVAFVGDASLDLVGTNVTRVTPGTSFAIQSRAACTGIAFGEENINGDSRFDDAIVRCGFLSVPESLIGAIGVLGTADGETCNP